MSKEYIISFRKKYDLRQGDLAEIIGVSARTIQNWEYGDREVPKSAMIILVDYEKKHPLGVNETANQSYTENRRNKKNSDNDDVIPLFDSVVAQQGTISNSLMPTTETDRKAFIKSNIFKNAQFVIYTAGNSMLPNYPPNSAIGIRRIEKRHISAGSVYAIDIGSDLLLKRIYYKNDDQYSGVLVLISDNDMIEESGARKGRLKYPPQEVDMDDVLGVYKITDSYKENEIRILKF